MVMTVFLGISLPVGLNLILIKDFFFSFCVLITAHTILFIFKPIKPFTDLFLPVWKNLSSLWGFYFHNIGRAVEIFQVKSR